MSNSKGSAPTHAPHPPRFSAVTYNCNGLSGHPTTEPGKDRNKRIAANVTRLTSEYDVVSLQESKLPAREAHYVNGLAPLGSKVFYSNLYKDKAGVVMIISPSLASRYDFTQLILPKSLTGYIVAVWGACAGLPPILLVNVYLKTGPSLCHFERKTEQLQALLCLPITRYTVLMGDFNFLEDPGDTTSASDYHNHPDTFRAAWDEFVGRHRLTEIKQEAHTYFKVCTKLESSHSSRLDRIYTSFGAAALGFLKPSAVLPILPYSLLNAYGAESLEEVCPRGSTAEAESSGRPKSNDLSGSDHLAVAMLLAPPAGNRKKSTAPPTWVASDPRLPALFAERWEVHRLDLDSMDVFEARQAFDDCYCAAGL